MTKVKYEPVPKRFTQKELSNEEAYSVTAKREDALEHVFYSSPQNHVFIVYYPESKTVDAFGTDTEGDFEVFEHTVEALNDFRKERSR
jgi:hypothetical protein